MTSSPQTSNTTALIVPGSYLQATSVISNSTEDDTSSTLLRCVPKKSVWSRRQTRHKWSSYSLWNAKLRSASTRNWSSSIDALNPAKNFGPLCASAFPSPICSGISNRRYSPVAATLKKEIARRVLENSGEFLENHLPKSAKMLDKSTVQRHGPVLQVCVGPPA